MGFVKNGVGFPSGGEYVNLGAAYANTANLAITPFVASSSATALTASMNLNAFPFTQLRVSSYQAGALTSSRGNLLRAAMRLSFGQSGYYFYRDTNLLYWCSGAGTFTDGGAGQINKPIGALDDCKGHGSLGSGWDISLSPTAANIGFTITGANGGSNLMNGTFGGGLVNYGTAGRSQSLWVR